MDFEIRPETAEDRSALWRLHHAAFGSTAEADLVDALRDGGYAEISLVAEVEEIIAGHILFSRLLVRTPDDSANALSLAPLAVLPEHQRQGVGSTLVVAGLNACRRAGYKIVTVLGQPSFYGRFGFSAQLAQPLQSPFGGGEAWMALELVPGSLQGVQGQVAFPPPFSALS